MLVTKGYLVWIAYGRKTNYQKWLSILGQMQRKFFTVDGHFVVEFGEGGAAPLFFCTLPFFKKLGCRSLVWTWLSTSVFRNEIFYCILNTLFYFLLSQSVKGLGYRLDDRGFGVWLSSGPSVCSLLQNLAYEPGVQTASCLIGTGLKRVEGGG